MPEHGFENLKETTMTIPDLSSTNLFQVNAELVSRLTGLDRDGQSSPEVESAYQAVSAEALRRMGAVA